MKLHVFGASGSGVTTLGELLATKSGLRYFDSDNYFWIKTEPPFTQRRSAHERNQLIIEDLRETENWILGGSIIHWGDHLFPKFDLVIFLYLPHEIRMERLKQRELERYGNIIYTDEKRAKKFNEFMAWAADYDNATGLANRTLKAHQLWLKQFPGATLEITGNLTLDEKLKLIEDKLMEEKIIITNNR